MEYWLSYSKKWALTSNTAEGQKISAGPEYTWISSATKIEKVSSTVAATVVGTGGAMDISSGRDGSVYIISTSEQSLSYLGYKVKML